LKSCFPAVVGGGIGGTSASYFLRELFGPNGVHIDLFEPYRIGGRLSVIAVNGRDYEVGGSVIHPRNKYMVDFLKLLGKSGLLDSNSFPFLVHFTLNVPKSELYNNKCFMICAIVTCRPESYI
jgi:predicted NAD/FAD-dependent oxidoreductase